LIACPDCGLAQRLPAIEPGRVAECARCRRLFARPLPARLNAALAFCIAAALLWVPGSSASLLLISTAGAVREGGIASGVRALWDSGFPFLGLVVAAFALATPWLYLVLLAYVLARVSAARARPSGNALPHVGAAYRCVKLLRPWMMLEVYLLGCCVAYSRVEQVAYVRVETAGWCLLAATLLALLAIAELDERMVWDALAAPARVPGSADPAGARPAAAIGCPVCSLLVEAHAAPCPRCGARLSARKPAALQRTAALVLTGFVLYIPANVLPVVSIERYGQVESDTILGGVLELARSGLWPLATIVFVASIVIPLAKLFGLSWNLLLTRRRSARLLVARTELHRLIDAVGRWSNIDIFMVSLLVALVQFGALTQVRAQPGAVAFACVVIITMLAAMAFDTRLMWDAAAERG
jgi:paraquat-inducible protein A